MHGSRPYLPGIFTGVGSEGSPELFLSLSHALAHGPRRTGTLSTRSGRPETSYTLEARYRKRSRHKRLKDRCEEKQKKPEPRRELTGVRDGRHDV